MKNKQKVAGDPNMSQLCEDGSCGCGCGLPMDTNRVFSEQKVQEVRSSAGEEALGVEENSVNTRPVEN
ncbi:MAG: hypothetical protein GTO12_19420 [Proteobacteria bacterium]|nr:hypothetical protein [Pseudomonadota bacterium]